MKSFVFEYHDMHAHCPYLLGIKLVAELNTLLPDDVVTFKRYEKLDRYKKSDEENYRFCIYSKFRSNVGSYNGLTQGCRNKLMRDRISLEATKYDSLTIVHIL